MISKKITAGAGAVMTLTGLVLQAYVNFNRGLQSGLNPYVEVLKMLGYMTIWTNILVFFVLFSDSFNRKPAFIQFLSNHSTKSATTVFILIVGLVYHFILSSTFQPQGTGKVANIILHYVTPAGFFLYWAFCENKIRLSYGMSVKWLLYPAAFALFSLIKGLFTHSYPYPFLDVTALGYSKVAVNILGLGIFYLMAGWIIIALNNQLAQREKLL